MTIEIKIEVNDQTLQKILDNVKGEIDMEAIAAAVGANIQLKVKAEALKLFLDILKNQNIPLESFFKPQA